MLLSTAILLATVAALLLARLVPWALHLARQARAISHFGGPSYRFLTGTTHHFPGKSKSLTTWVSLMKKYPRGIRGYIGPFVPTLLLWHPDTAAALVVKGRNDPKFPLIYSSVEPWLGRGLLTASGPHWFRARRLLTPAFHFNILTRYSELFIDEARLLGERWSAALTTATMGGLEVELLDTMSQLSVNVLLRSAFSNASREQCEPYAAAVRELAELVTRRASGPVLPKISAAYYNRTPDGKRFRELCDFVHTYSEGLIAERKKLLLEQDPAHGGPHGVPAAPTGCKLDFLDLLLTAKDADGKGLSQEDIREQVDTFLFAGHDTTACGVSWALNHLAKHPDIQRRVQTELDDVLAGATPTQTSVADLKFLNWVVKESLRLSPPASGFFRKLESPLVIDGVTIPKGTAVGVNIHTLHRHPEVWGEDAEEFRPDRWENPPKQSTAYMPFSAGSRNCIGQNFALLELKIVLATVLQHFNVSPSEEFDEAIPVAMIVLRSLNGIHIRVTGRSH